MGFVDEMPKPPDGLDDHAHCDILLHRRMGLPSFPPPCRLLPF